MNLILYKVDLHALILAMMQHLVGLVDLLEGRRVQSTWCMRVYTDGPCKYNCEWWEKIAINSFVWCCAGVKLVVGARWQAW